MNENVSQKLKAEQRERDVMVASVAWNHVETFESYAFDQSGWRWAVEVEP